MKISNRNNCEIKLSTYSSDMCESSSQAFLGSLAPSEVTLLSYGLGGLAGAGSIFPLSSRTGAACTSCFPFE